MSTQQRNPRTSKALSQVAWACALAAVLALGAGCGDYAVSTPPQVNVTVDNVQVIAGKCSMFAADRSNGQLTFDKHVVVRNSGKGVLCLNQVKWTTANTLLKMSYTTPKPTDAKACPAAGAIALAAGKSVGIDVAYLPSPDKVDMGQATLTIEHNATPESPISLCFGISPVGPQISVDAAEDTFVNVSAPSSETHCDRVGNSGDAPLCFDHAVLDPANAKYSIVEKPTKGDCIPPLGDAGNPVMAPTKWMVCVRYSPGGPGGDDDDNLIIATNDPNMPNAQVILHAKTETGTYTVACTTTKGGLLYDFGGVTSGTAQATCAITNVGPAGMAISPPAVQATDPAIDPAKIAGMYAICGHTSATDPACVGWPLGVAAGSTVYLTIRFTFPATNDPANGNLVVPFVQAMIPEILTIPISAGGCDVPAPAFGPQQLWLLAGLGQKATGTYVIANQSCAPLRVLNACITSAASTTGDPCSKPASLSSGLAKPFASQDVAPWGVLPLEVEFHPVDGAKQVVNDFLNMTYCAGVWAGGKCSGAIVTQVLNLQGSIQTGIAPPTLSLSALTDYAGPVHGQPLHLEATFSPGQYPDGHNYSWLLTKRPPGSTRWLTSMEQTTSTPDLVFIPDVPGDYEVAAMAQAIEDGTPADYDWSAQVKIAFTAK